MPPLAWGRQQREGWHTRKPRRPVDRVSGQSPRCCRVSNGERWRWLSTVSAAPDHEKANRRLMLSPNCRFGAVSEYGRVLAGGMTGLASQAEDTMALESATAADRPGAMTVTADGLAGEVHMPRQVSVDRAWGGPSPIALGRQVVLPSAIHPVSHDSTEGADPGVSLLLQPSWLPGLPGRVSHLHPHLAGRLSCALSRDLTGS